MARRARTGRDREPGAEADVACDAIGRVRDSNYRQSLLDLAVFAVERTH